MLSGGVALLAAGVGSEVAFAAWGQPPGSDFCEVGGTTGRFRHESDAKQAAEQAVAEDSRPAEQAIAGEAPAAET